MTDLTARLAIVKSILFEPSTNLAAAFVLYAAIVVVALILIVVLYSVIVLPSSTRLAKLPAGIAPAGAPETESAKTKRRRKAIRRTPPLVIVLIALAAVASTYWMTGQDYVCIDACHAEAPAVASADKDVHRAQSCASCHEERLPLGAVDNTAQRLRMGVAFLADSEVGGGVPVSGTRCLGCHEKVTRGVLTSKERYVRMSHAEPVDAGIACTECHGRAGHAATPVAVSMNRCLPCHDDETASSACATCHVGDPGRTRRAVSEIVYPQVEVSRKDCGGCHAQDTCDACHGTRMPHPDAFIEGGHAKPAAFEGKQSCFRCHQEWECNDCHMPFATGHAANWKTEHAKSPRDASCACHAPRNERTTSFCVRCH